MTFAVVIPSYRRADLLELCLRSVRTHQPVDTEIVVVDDGSVGGIVAACATKFDCTVVRHEKPKGFAVAANAGVAATEADIVELLNDDTEVTADWATNAVARFADPAVVAVAPLVLMHPATQPGPFRIDSAGDEWDRGGFARKRGHDRPVSDEYRQPGPVWGVSAAAGFYRRSAFVAAGGFPADFGAYFEDVDLSHRLRTLGRIEFEPSSIVWHRVSASYGRLPSRETLTRQSCNEERVYWRNRPEWRTWPRHAGVLAGKALRRLCEGEFEPWLRGRFRAVLPYFRAAIA